MDITDKMMEVLGKGLDASKKALYKAGDAVQDFSDRNVIKLEKRQLAAKRAKVCESLGEKVAVMIIEQKKTEIPSDDSAVAGCITQIEEIDKDIAYHEYILKNPEKKEENTDSEKNKKK